MNTDLTVFDHEPMAPLEPLRPDQNPPVRLAPRLEELAEEIRRCTRYRPTWREKGADERRRLFLQDIFRELMALADRGNTSILAADHDAIVRQAQQLSAARREIAQRDEEIAFQNQRLADVRASQQQNHQK